MEIIKLYKSFDDEVFDTEEECIEHEKLANSVFDKIKFFDADKKPLIYTDLFGSLDKAYNKAIYTEIIDKDVSDYFGYYTGYILPDDTGFYEYDGINWLKVDGGD